MIWERLVAEHGFQGHYRRVGGLTVLANLFLHYAFDAWMAREYPPVRFERYVDDVVMR